jgi:nucleoside-diphosphate-sugar epimerase
MKKIIVTGAGGYVGVPLCEVLLKKGYYVIALDRYFFGLDKMDGLKDHPNLDIKKEDLRYCDVSVFKDVYAVLDLAGLSNDASAEIDPALTQAINYKGAERFAREAKKNGVQRFIYSSSASVYGAGEKQSLSEGDPLNPQTEYARSKVAMEKILMELKDKNFHPTMLRNATVFGLAPRMRFDLAVNIMTMRAWKERVIYVMGGGEQWRPFVHVRDVVNAFILSLEAPLEKVDGEVFNVGSSELNYQIKQLAQFVVDIIPNVTIHTIPDDADKRTYNLNFEKIKRVLGFEVSVQIHEGVVEIKQALEKGIIHADDPTTHTLQWYKSLLTWSKRVKELSYKGEII